jgi:hypothetical protein
MDIHEIQEHILVAAIGIADNKRKSDRRIVSMYKEEEEQPLDEHKQRTVKILTARAKRLDAAIKGLEELLK